MELVITVVTTDERKEVAIEKINGFFREHGIDNFKNYRLTEANNESMFASEWHFDVYGSLTIYQQRVKKISEAIEADVFCRPKHCDINKFNMIAFDMDSTLIGCEVVDELAKHHGVWTKVAEITQQAMIGKLDFEQSFIQRAKLLAGLSVNTMNEIGNSLPINEGVTMLIRFLHSKGYVIGLISGGLSHFGDCLTQQLNLDFSCCNSLKIANNELTGEVIHPIITAKKKAELLTKKSEAHQVSLQHCIAVGDGANDLDMLKIAGMGVAYHAKNVLKRATSYQLNHTNMDALLYFLGVKESEFKQAK